MITLGADLSCVRTCLNTIKFKILDYMWTREYNRGKYFTWDIENDVFIANNKEKV